MKIATRHRLRRHTTQSERSAETPCALAHLSRQSIASRIRDYLHATNYFVLWLAGIFSTILSHENLFINTSFILICRRDSMALGMRIAYRLLYACQHGRLIKDFFTAKNPASSDYLL